MVKPLTQLKLSVQEASTISESNYRNQSNELYPCRVVAHNVNSGGIELPIPFQIVSQDQIKSRLEPYALNMIISKANSGITKPETLAKPTSRAQLEHIT